MLTKFFFFDKGSLKGEESDLVFPKPIPRTAFQPETHKLDSVFRQIRTCCQASSLATSETFGFKRAIACHSRSTKTTCA
jgi:hypothetical protein